MCPVIDRPVAVGGLLACARPEPFMTLPRSVADVLSDHVLFEVESIDRMYCNLHVPQLQRAEGIVGFIHGHLGQPIASTAVIAPMSRDFVARLRVFAEERGIPRVDFARGQRKDDVMHQYLAAFEAAGRREGVPSSPSPRCWTARHPGGSSSIRSSPTISISAARTGSA